jgi:hypothetical protein
VVYGFELTDLQLRRNGISRGIAGTATLEQTGLSSYSVGNLSTLTLSSGEYTLAIASGSGVTDAAGNQIFAPQLDTWFTTTPWFEGGSVSTDFAVTYRQADGMLVVNESRPGFTPRTYLLPRASNPFLNFRSPGSNDRIDINLTGSDLVIGLQAEGGGIHRINVSGGTVRLQPITGGAMILQDLTVNPAAMLDVGSHTVVLQPPAAQRESLFNSLIPLLRSGRNEGAWDGPGINSSTAAGDARRITGLALIQNPGCTSGAPCIVLSNTLNGDSDIDGDIDADDYARIDAGYASGGLNYQNGDFDYSGGAPDADDYFLIDLAFGTPDVHPGLRPGAGVASSAMAASAKASSSRSVRKPTIKAHHRKPVLRWRHRWEWPRSS